jgi:hypothetical protein
MVVTLIQSVLNDFRDSVKGARNRSNCIRADRAGLFLQAHLREPCQTSAFMMVLWAALVIGWSSSAVVIDGPSLISISGIRA